MSTLPAFVSAGEALTDLLRTGPDSWRSQVGGSTWNVARVVARLGLPSAFAGAVSRDVFGAALATAKRCDPTLARMARLADVIKVSDEHLRGLFRTGDADGAFSTCRRLHASRRGAAHIRTGSGTHGTLFGADRGLTAG